MTFPFHCRTAWRLIFSITSFNRWIRSLSKLHRTTPGVWSLSFYLDRFAAMSSTVYTLFSHDDVIKWNHFPRYWSVVRGIHRSPVNSPHKGQWRGALIFSLICPWTYGWVKHRDDGDQRRHCVLYDVVVMPHMTRCNFCLASWILYIMYSFVLQVLMWCSALLGPPTCPQCPCARTHPDVPPARGPPALYPRLLPSSRPRGPALPRSRSLTWCRDCLDQTLPLEDGLCCGLNPDGSTKVTTTSTPPLRNQLDTGPTSPACLDTTPGPGPPSRQFSFRAL